MSTEFNIPENELVSRCEFAVGDIIDDRWKVIKQVGEGTFGIVYCVERVGMKTGELFALKLLKLWTVIAGERKNLRRRFEREYEAGLIESPYLVHSIERGSVCGNCYIVMEYCSGGDLMAACNKGSVNLAQVALAALGTGVWFAFGDEIKGMVDTESKASENEDTGVKELSDNIKMRMAIVSNNLSIGTNSDFAPLVEARCQYDTIKSIIKENPSLNDEFEDELAELERKLEENLISASEAWINQANILFADGFDDDTAIGYLQYAAAINPSGEALGLLAKKGVEVALCKLSIKGDKMSIVCTPTGKNVDTTLKYTIYDKNFNAKCAGTFPVSISDNKAERINVILPDAIEDGTCYVYFANADDKNIAYLELK